MKKSAFFILVISAGLLGPVAGRADWIANCDYSGVDGSQRQEHYASQADCNNAIGQTYVSSSHCKCSEGGSGGGSSSFAPGLMGLGLGMIGKGLAGIGQPTQAEQEQQRQAQEQAEARAQQQKEEQEKLQQEFDASKKELLQDVGDTSSLEDGRSNHHNGLNDESSGKKDMLADIEDDGSASVSSDVVHKKNIDSEKSKPRSASYTKGYKDALGCYSSNAGPYCLGSDESSRDQCVKDYNAGFRMGLKVQASALKHARLLVIGPHLSGHPLS